MRGARSRIDREGKMITALAWQNAAFYGQAMSKQGLKPLNYYLRERSKAQSADEMRANMLIIAQRVNRLHKEDNDG